MSQEIQSQPLPQWLITIIGMAVAVGISWGVNGARQDALADRLARIEIQVLTQQTELTRVARLEERLTAMAATLTEIREELRSHDQNRLPRDRQVFKRQ